MGVLFFVVFIRDRLADGLLRNSSTEIRKRHRLTRTACPLCMLCVPQMLNLSKQSLPGVPEGGSSTEESWPMDLGMAVANKLLTEFTFLKTRTDDTATSFTVPEGDEWFDPVVDAVVTITKTAASKSEVKGHLFPETPAQEDDDAEHSDERVDPEVDNEDDDSSGDNSSDQEGSDDDSDAAGGVRSAEGAPQNTIGSPSREADTEGEDKDDGLRLKVSRE